MSSKHPIAPYWPRLALGEPRYALLFIAYLLLGLLATLHNQPWRDEAQAWLLARDNTLLGILKLERYEAIPGLWHLLLYFPTHLGMPYITLHIFHWALNGLAVYIILKWLRFDFGLTVGIIFSYLIFYEYGVIARNYVLTLLGLAILAAAWFGPWSKCKYWIYLGFFITAGSSLFGLWLAVPIAVSLWCKIRGEQGLRKALVPAALLGCIGLLCFLPIVPGVCTRLSAEPPANRQLGRLGALASRPSAPANAPASSPLKKGTGSELNGETPAKNNGREVPGPLLHRAAGGSDKQMGPEEPTATKTSPGPADAAHHGASRAARPRSQVRDKSTGGLLGPHPVELVTMAFYFAFSQGGFEDLLCLASLPMFVPQVQVGLGVTFLVFATLFLLRRPRYAALFIGMTAGVLAILLTIPLSPVNLRHSCSLFLAFLFCWWLMQNDPNSSSVWPQRLPAVIPRLSQLGNSLSGAGIRVILSLQVLAAAVAIYENYEYHFSEAKETAQYLKTQGLLPNAHCFWISCDTDSAAGVLAYFDNIRMYSLDGGEPESYMMWDRKYLKNRHMTNAEAAARLATIATRQQGKTVMILASHKLTFPLGRTHTLQLLKSFEPALKDNESFYIYRYQ
jgi:hypothetical protein